MRDESNNSHEPPVQCTMQWEGAHWTEGSMHKIVMIEQIWLHLRKEIRFNTNTYHRIGFLAKAQSSRRRLTPDPGTCRG